MKIVDRLPLENLEETSVNIDDNSINLLIAIFIEI